MEGRSVKVRRKKPNEKPRTKFCWDCGKKFMGSHFAVIEFDDGLDSFVHIQCAKGYDRNFK